jgi:selenocysteine lyase/cysteine desulfurase
MPKEVTPADDEFWQGIREQFGLDPDTINLAVMSISPQRLAVRKKQKEYACQLDAKAWGFLSAELMDAEKRVHAAVGEYFNIDPNFVALTDGTTQGLSLLFAGLKIRPDQEILTTNHEYFGALDCFAHRAQLHGTRYRPLVLIPDPAHFNPDVALEILARKIRPETRVLALTWVYSSSGVKLPISAIAELVRAVNAERSSDDRIIFCVDGVHGFGVEDTTFPELGCDFFVSGCHKWAYGPRGTGIWCGTPEAWKEYVTVTPSTTGDDNPGWVNSPGGLHSYEDRWPLDVAFEFLTKEVGKRNVQERIRYLATLLKDELRKLPHVQLVTPYSAEHSAGIVCFDVDEFREDPSATTSVASAVVKALKGAAILASVSSIDRARPERHHARVSVSIFNTVKDVRACVDVVKTLVVKQP